MLDTMKLSIKEYSISGDSKLTVQPASFIAGTGEVISEFPLFRDKNGTERRGSKAYLNNEKFNLTIKPFTRSNIGTACFLQFSIPKVYSNDNYYGITNKQTEQTIDLVEHELKENGFSTSLREADISRVDTFKNVIPEEPFSSYYSLFPLLKARRKIQRGYGTTFLVHNTQQQFCIYDKLEEMRARGVMLDKYPEKTMRFEHRLLNKAKVKAVYGFSGVEELFKGGFDVVREKQLEGWKKALFSHTVEEVVMFGALELETEMRMFKEKYPKNWFGWFLKSYGAFHLAKYAGVEVVKLALQNIDSDRMKVWRAEKLLEDTKREIDMLKKDKGSDKTLGTLYRELQEKVLN